MLLALAFYPGPKAKSAPVESCGLESVSFDLYPDLSSLDRHQTVLRLSLWWHLYAGHIELLTSS